MLRTPFACQNQFFNAKTTFCILFSQSLDLQASNRAVDSEYLNISSKYLNIGLKEVVRMVTSIPLIRCLCYKPEPIRTLELTTTYTSTCLTLSNTKRGTDLGTLVVPLDQTFHPLHLYLAMRNLQRSS